MEVIPLKYEFLSTLRRTSLDEPVQLQKLRSQLIKANPEHAYIFENYYFRLVSEELQMQITTDAELETAYRRAHQRNKVLRLRIPVVHFGETCDITGMTPIVGPMFVTARPARCSFTLRPLQHVTVCEAGLMQLKDHQTIDVPFIKVELPANGFPSCPHVGCELTGTRKCCACSDTRYALGKSLCCVQLVSHTYAMFCNQG